MNLRQSGVMEEQALHQGDAGLNPPLPLTTWFQAYHLSFMSGFFFWKMGTISAAKVVLEIKWDKYAKCFLKY